MRASGSAILLLLALAVPPAAAQDAASWVAAASHAGVAYFLRTGAAQVARYDLAAQQWLPPLALTGTGTAMAVGDAGVFVGLGRRIARLDPATGIEQHLRNTAADVRELALAGPLVASLADGQGLVALDSATGAFVDATPAYAAHGLRGLSAARSRRRLFGRQRDLSPSDIVAVPLLPGGRFGAPFESPYHGDYPDAARTFVFPGERRVADDSGTVYTTNDLTYAGSLGRRFDDLAFYGDLPIVLRGRTLFAHDPGLRETGRHELTAAAQALFVHGDVLFAFSGDGVSIAVEAVPVGALGPLAPGAPIDPTGLAYRVDGAVQAPDGTVYVLSRGTASVFRWLPATRTHGPTIRLWDAARYLAHSPVTNRLYLAYPSGAISQIRLDDGDLEEPFANAPAAPCGLATAGELVFVCDESGAWASHGTYAPDGVRVSQEEWNYVSREYVWSPELRRMYFFRDDTSPNDLLAEPVALDGTLGAVQDSPYHGELAMRHPIRIAPGSTSILTGAGLFFDPVTLQHTNDLSNDLDEAAWVGGALHTLRRVAPPRDLYEWRAPVWGVTDVQAWGPGTHPELWRRPLPGLPRGLFAAGSTPVALVDVGGVPHWIALACGDGVVDPYEQCDGTNLGGASCTSLGLGQGALACTAGCRFDATGCAVGPTCGDGVVDRLDEVCDGADLGVGTGLVSCAMLGFASGQIGCAEDCRDFTTTGCNACGNDVVDFAEECDGADFRDATCAHHGFPGGTLGCTADCRVSTDACHRDCALQPCEDDDVCTIDRCATETGCSHEALEDCTALTGVLVMSATATVQQGDIVGDCAGRCGTRARSAILVHADGTYRIPSGPVDCPGEQVAIPDETGTLRPARRGREAAVPSNLREVLRAAARCAGIKLKLRRAKTWIRRAGGEIIEGRSTVDTVERRQGISFRVHRVTRLAGPGHVVEPPRRFERLADCANGLRLRCVAR